MQPERVYQLGVLKKREAAPRGEFILFGRPGINVDYDEVDLDPVGRLFYPHLLHFLD